jgi:hypothetical protein
MSTDYAQFIEQKSQCGEMSGCKPHSLPSYLFDFQAFLADWSIRMGRSATFLDCGLGKTLIEFVFGQNVVEETNKPVLMLCPLAVSCQMLKEADKFGVEIYRSSDGVARKPITVTNYQQLHKFNENDFSGVICDESGILKHQNSVTRNRVTHFMRKMKYRLLATATPAPNDYTELGNSSEALGYLGLPEMLTRFFKNDQNNSDTKTHKWMGKGGGVSTWRFKGHAEEHFWRWVCSWARAGRKPSDLGDFEDERFVLPGMIQQEYIIEPRSLPPGELFQRPAFSLYEQREERRRTLQERCEKVAELVSAKSQRPVAVWCHLNAEGDLLEKLIPNCIQVKGADSDDEKEEKLMTFTNRQADCIVTKSSIAGWGLNWQHCWHQVHFPTHSFEQFFQSVRRSLRFGQKRKVHIDIVSTVGEKLVMDNLLIKAAAADKMLDRIVELVNEELKIRRSNEYAEQEEIPTWA